MPRSVEKFYTALRSFARNRLKYLRGSDARRRGLGSCIAVQVLIGLLGFELEQSRRSRPCGSVEAGAAAVAIVERRNRARAAACLLTQLPARRIHASPSQWPARWRAAPADRLARALLVVPVGDDLAAQCRRRVPHAHADHGRGSRGESAACVRLARSSRSVRRREDGADGYRCARARRRGAVSAVSNHDVSASSSKGFLWRMSH